MCKQDTTLYMIKRIRKEQRLYCKRHKRYKHKGHTGRVHLYLLKQNFTAHETNELCVSDITYIWTDEGWLYLADVKDLYCKELIDYNLCQKMTASLYINDLQKAITQKTQQAHALFILIKGSNPEAMPITN